ncbi:MAG: DinB family protein [Acidobacteria bacterium]|nr:DinB family protein [Acidobacteriota bacterium]
MRRALVCSFVIALLACGLAVLQPAAAQTDAKHSMHDAAAMPAASDKAAAPAAAGEQQAPGVRTAAWHQIANAQKELLALAEAMPAEKYSWRPAAGVRSVGEVYMHVASANYFLPTFWGVKFPASVDPRTLEKDGGDKAKTVAALKASFEHLHQAIDSLPDADLGKPVDFFGRKATVADIVLGAASHAHEHLGQSIAYARMNGVVPPWSAAENQRGR